MKHNEKIDKRAEILRLAEHNVCGHREQDYGTPEKNFGIIGRLWSVWLGVDVTAIDVAVMMGMLKMARIKGNQSYADNWIDLIGYAACGAEIANKGDKE